MWQRLKTSAIDINRITHALKGKEADTHWQEDIPWLEIMPYHLAYHSSKEVGILEISKQT